MAPRRRCQICGSKRWHKQGGRIACSEGHILENYIEESREADEWTSGAFKTTRKLKVQRDESETAESKRKANKNFYGIRAKFHIVQCQQLLLRLQTQALIKLWHLPAELEVVCRDVWALRLTLLADPLSIDGIYMTSDDQEEESSVDERTGDKDLEELLEEESESEATEEEDDPDPDKAQAQARAFMSRRRKALVLGEGKPINNIVVLIISCWMLRIPVLYADFIKAIEGFDIPFHDPLKHLPEKMTQHLNAHDASHISPRKTPTQARLQESTRKLCRQLHNKYGVRIPEMNATPVIWRAIKQFHGSPLLYVLTKRLLGLLKAPLVIHENFSRTRTENGSSLPRHNYFRYAPEVTIVATVFIVLKLLYGFDEQDRTPHNSNDPGLHFPVLNEFVESLKEVQDDSLQFDTRDQWHPEQMSDQKIDEYLDFCQKNLLVNHSSRDDEGCELASFHPISAPERNIRSQSEPVHHQWAFEYGDRIVLDPTKLKLGERHKIYSSEDATGTFPDLYEKLLNRAAKWACVESSLIASVVHRLEKQLVKVGESK